MINTRYMVRVLNGRNKSSVIKRNQFLFNRVNYSWNQIFNYAVKLKGVRNNSDAVSLWLVKQGIELIEDKEW